MRLLLHAGVVVGLTLLTQIGGVVWVLAMVVFGRTSLLIRMLSFLVLYAGATMATAKIAPAFGLPSGPA